MIPNLSRTSRKEKFPGVQNQCFLSTGVPPPMGSRVSRLGSLRADSREKNGETLWLRRSFSWPWPRAALFNPKHQLAGYTGFRDVSMSFQCLRKKTHQFWRIHGTACPTTADRWPDSYDNHGNAESQKDWSDGYLYRNMGSDIPKNANEKAVGHD